MAYTPKNFVNLGQPTVDAAWLNGVDITCNLVLGGAQTVTDAQVALGIPVGGLSTPVIIAQGGTGASTASAALAALGGTTLAAAESAINPYPTATAAEIAANVTPINYTYPPCNVLRYGTNTVPGTTDMTAAIQAAITVAGNIGGGPVILPPSASYVDATITLSQNGVWVIGAAGGSSIYVGSTTLDVFEITANTCTLSDFEIVPAAGVIRSGGYYVNFIGAISHLRIQRVDMFNFYDAVGFTGTGGGTTIRVMDCDIQTNVNGGVGLNFVNTNPPVDVVLENLFITGLNLANQMLAGIQLVNVGDCTLKHVSTVYTGQGLNAAPGSGQEVQALFMSDCFFDSNTNNAININPAAGGSVYLVKAVNIWACTSASGIVLGSSNTGTIANTEWVNCYCSNNAAGSGFYIAGTIVADTLIEGGGFSENNYGITIASGVTNFKIIGARIKSTGQFNANNTTNSLYMVGACDKFTIADCDFGTNAVSFPAMSLGVGGQTWFVYGNQGFVTNGSGMTGAIASGATVTHGLATTPTVILLQQQGAAPSAVYPSSIGATTFAITYTGGGTNVFAWKAGFWGN